MHAPVLNLYNSSVGSGHTPIIYYFTDYMCMHVHLALHGRAYA